MPERAPAHKILAMMNSARFSRHAFVLWITEVVSCWERESELILRPIGCDSHRQKPTCVLLNCVLYFLKKPIPYSSLPIVELPRGVTAETWSTIIIERCKRERKGFGSAPCDRLGISLLKSAFYRRGRARGLIFYTLLNCYRVTF